MYTFPINPNYYSMTLQSTCILYTGNNYTVNCREQIKSGSHLINKDFNISYMSANIMVHCVNYSNAIYLYWRCAKSIIVFAHILTLFF